MKSSVIPAPLEHPVNTRTFMLPFRKLLDLVSCHWKWIAVMKLQTSISVPNLLNEVKKTFDVLPNPRQGRSQISLTDCLMSGLAIFSLKYPSLLQFEQDKIDETLVRNLKTLYQINRAPSDTYLRERLDEINPHLISKGLKKYFRYYKEENI